MKPSEAGDGVWLVYDGECPVCSAYGKYARVREAVGELHLVDARQPGALMDRITGAGLDMDQGMVVKLGGTLYYGPDAVRVLALLSTPSGMVNRVSFLLFGTPGRARVFYPLVKAIRRGILTLLGSRRIGNLKATTPSGRSASAHRKSATDRRTPTG